MGERDRIELTQTTWPVCSSSIRGRNAFVVWEMKRTANNYEEGDLIQNLLQVFGTQTGERN